MNLNLLSIFAPWGRSVAYHYEHAQMGVWDIYKSLLAYHKRTVFSLKNLYKETAMWVRGRAARKI